MRVGIDLKKSLQQNADSYYERSKKAKKKLVGVKKAIIDMGKKIEKLKKEEEASKKETKVVKKRKRKWFEKFHWFVSSNGFLVIGGKDAKSNEIVVKKHMDESDLYFHPEIQGASHVVVKSKDNSAPEQTLREAAQFAAAFSKAWKEGIPAIDVYSVLPKQVSKKSPSGEAIGPGAFMIYGERKWFNKTPLNFAVGVKEDDGSYVIVSGPASAVEKQAAFSVQLKQGSQSKGSIAKKLKSIFEEKLGEKNIIDLDEIIAMLPAGEFEIEK